MDSFRILKTDLEGKDKFWDIFEVDSFGFSSGVQIKLSVDQVNVLLDRYAFYPVLPDAELMSELIHMLFTSIGGTKDTPVQEVLAISYLFFMTPNLRVKDMFNSVVKAIHCFTTLSYLVENEKDLPSQYLMSMKNVIQDDPLYHMVVARYPDLKVITTLSEEEFLAWITEVDENMHDYIKGINATKNLFK
jgi:hypothetical protein